MILSEQLSKKIVNIMSDNNIIDSHLDAAYIYTALISLWI